MRITLAVHIAAGTVGLVAGYVALYAAKAGTLHRRSGMLFVYAMLTMSLGGVAMAVGQNVAPAVNVPASLLTSYLVITALTTVRPFADRRRWLAVGATLVALGVGATMVAFGAEAIANGGRRNGMPAFPFFLFGVIALVGAAGDFRVMRSDPLAGASRLARHLWRMCTALFIAALSFSVQAAKLVPKSARMPGMFALPVVAVVATMIYWLWRVRRTRARRPIALRAAAEAA
ncbi:MAG: hypothetical protein DMF93_01340 [Acidobacteria bacterium]|nr:MAG: hypothetical protein DMF93_01340 [Acidobacteriota bacterium]